MMMSLGLFVFKLNTLPYQTLHREVNYNWQENTRIGQRPVSQFLGLGKESMKLSGLLLPEVTGGISYLQVLEGMAESGRAWPLIEGSGTIYGMFIIENMTHDNTEINSNGQARSISFSVSLKRVDESQAAMFGDLLAQAEGLFNKASSAVSNFVQGV
ncbi:MULTISPECIES: phage tail protein [Rahnella]|jgi:phage protein U|uniref:Phage tail protein n=1 Tax=Rahnella contaminans TaxID=2703882 RepID=A0A6M2B8B7_9GAMM|nr:MULTISPECIES: phage tail protein [Rahnella]KAB8311538.1 phage tail protein [Rouxiella chamberiensis]MBU9822767.1 phage tail protein [Rahnella sp. BCC 1045]MCS3425883.1 phage protein U [Rahnella sp. BIGb0603]NGX89560.1 phage tail protein [Rahnella contaminans]